MCGIFGCISSSPVDSRLFYQLGCLSSRRGQDSSGLVYYDDQYYVDKADLPFKRLYRLSNPLSSKVLLGHSRLITNGQSDNQPVVFPDKALLHNGIIINHESLWNRTDATRKLQIDSESILAITSSFLDHGGQFSVLYPFLESTLVGSFSCALALPKYGKLLLFSNTGSLYVGKHKDGHSFFASEASFLHKLSIRTPRQIQGLVSLDIPYSNKSFVVNEYPIPREDLIPSLGSIVAEEKLLHYKQHSLRRCTRCILPETMPFIQFNNDGVCNYCTNYKKRNKPKDPSVLIIS